MPGYELELFIDLTQIEKSELTCSICQDIFRSPVVTTCCQQTFCEQCVHEWLIGNNSCPFCRKKLKQNNLMRPPRLLLNMLANLRLHCKFREKGCHQILLLEGYDKHVKSCLFNKKVCPTCECEQTDDHNCVTSLLQMNKLLKEDVDSAQVKNDMLMKKLQDSKNEKEDLLQTIQNLSRNSPVLRMKNFSKLSDYQMIIESRQCIPVIYSRKTCDSMAKRIAQIVTNSLNSEQNLGDVCKVVKESVESEMDGMWHCTAFYDDIGSHCFTFDDLFFVSLLFGKLKITVHKVYDDINIKKLAQLLRSGKVKEELTIEKTDMNVEHIAIVKDVVINGIKLSNNLQNLSKYISKELTKSLDGIWHVFSFRVFLANCYVLPKIGRFINITISDLNIVIFQV